VGIQAELDLLHHGRGQAGFAHQDDRFQAMGFGAQDAAFGRGKVQHSYFWIGSLKGSILR